MGDGELTPERRWLHETVEAWAAAMGHATNALAETNRAVLSAYGLTDERSGTDVTTDAVAATASERNASGSRPDAAAAEFAGTDLSDWRVERDIDDPATLGVGNSVRFSKRLDEADVTAFARASGDTNPLHLDDEFAGRTRFGRRIVHGTLVSGLVSAALARLPGLVIYVSQDVTFLEPVDVGQRLTAVVTVVEEVSRDRYRLSTDVVDAEGDSVLEGEAVVVVDPLP
ncbi:MaoC family dehydratase [Halogeometricum luteum]|uniref:MaoC family dehydratase n=1 Tax=Halogeometricum luteum TaxID=2950537 RepID=A0ABU2G447_9EURY|nr:MaoC family dehydratase [Halogeometricum sp. S3BR5-2]MDS0295251.1 MaoC family dehydratase [Halogeometricum sp. S3BR5-2]